MSLSIVSAPPPTSGSITVGVSSLTFSYVTGTAPSSQKFSVTGASNAQIPVTVTLQYGVPPAPGWLSLANAQGTTLLSGSTLTTPVQLTAGINPAGLAPGTYNATIVLTPSGGSPVSTPVSLTITAGSAMISLSPSSLSFVYQPNSGVNGVPAPQTVAVTVSGAPNTSFSLQEASFLGWVGAAPSSGTAPGSFSVAVSPINSAPGIYTSSFTVTLPQTNPVVTATLPVTLTINGPSGVTQFAATSGPAGSLTRGPDGAMWFTEPTLGRIGRITPGGSVTEFPLPTANPQPGPMTLGPDGNLWFAEASPARIAKMTTTGAVTEFNLPLSSTSVAGITTGPDGNLWVTEYNENKIAKITPSGTTTEYALASLASPGGITKGPDGNVWFTESGINKIAKMTPSGVITEYAVPSVTLGALVTGPDGNIWFPEWDLSSVGKMTVTGSITQYPVGAFSGGITVGSDGNLWVGNLSFLGSVTSKGSSNIVFLSPVVSIFDVTSGVDGNLWFTDSEGIARYTLNKGTLGIALVVSAASFQGGGVAPGEIITVGGTNFGLAAPLGLTLDPDGKVATSLGGLTVSINGFYAPLLYASATQINCIVPYALAGSGGSADLAVTSAGLFDSVPVALAQAAPGIFTALGSGSGNAAILNADGSYNSSQDPAPQGSTITFYLTGEGQTNPAGVTGSVTAPNTSGSGPLTPQPALPVSVTIGGTPAPITFLGEAPGLVAGVMQINAQVPAGIASGSVPLVVSIGGVASQGNVTVAVK